MCIVRLLRREVRQPGGCSCGHAFLQPKRPGLGVVEEQLKAFQAWESDETWGEEGPPALPTRRPAGETEVRPRFTEWRRLL